MQIYLPILALALDSVNAIDEPHQVCADFITVRSGAPQKLNRRVRRDQSHDWSDATTTEGYESRNKLTFDFSYMRKGTSAFMTLYYTVGFFLLDHY